MIHTDYLQSALDKRERKHEINKMVNLINDSKVEFDTIAFRGMSGALMAPAIADMLDKHIIVVRSSKLVSHTSREVEGYSSHEGYIIIDDFVETGNTVTHIIRAVQTITIAPLQAIFLYGYSTLRTWNNIPVHCSNFCG